jgi:hypothetical protein
MKTIFHLCVIAIFSIATVSCKKSDLSDVTSEPTVYTEPTISSKINPFIIEPSALELGTEFAVIHTDEKVTFFIPYSITNENIKNATVTMTDDATGLTVNTYNLIPSSDPSASSLNFPDNMELGKEFYFISFVASEEYVGKTISISTRISGESTTSRDQLNAAFSVTP